MKRKISSIVCLILFAAVFALSAAACNNKRTPTVYTLDPDRDFGIWGDVDLDATQDEGAVVFSAYRVGFVDDE